MRLLVITPHLEPDTAPTGVVVSRIVSELCAAGHEVHVVTSLPWYREHRVEGDWRGRLVRRGRAGDASVVRLTPFAGDKASLASRALGFVAFSGAAALAGVAARIDGDQALFGATGAVHAAAVFDRTGEPLLLREDIGRHNAVDKVVGRLHLDGGLPANDLGLWVSGRASFEMAQKAWAAGFAALVAVSGPSALAVETARVAGLQLAGFARGERLNLYTGD